VAVSLLPPEDVDEETCGGSSWLPGVVVVVVLPDAGVLMRKLAAAGFIRKLAAGGFKRKLAAGDTMEPKKAARLLLDLTASPSSLMVQ
jgi:hypothetical protein